MSTSEWHTHTRAWLIYTGSWKRRSRHGRRTSEDSWNTLCEHRYRNYEYQPLEPGQIRVLDLLSQPGEELRCRLRHVDITAPAQHVALSYVWGDESKPFWIPVLDCQGGNRVVGRVSLTVSLRNALQDLRDCEYFQQSKTFWIDQLCINQTDDLEKNLQVAQMMQIYETARETVTYMGPEDPKDREALLLLDTLYQFYMASRFKGLLADIIGRPEQYDRQYKQHDGVPLELRFEASTVRLDRDTYEHLGAIISSPWNDRVWLVQENVANRQAGFLRGPNFFSWEPIGTVAALSNACLLPYIQAAYEVAIVFGKRFVRFELESSRRVDPDEQTLYHTIHGCSQRRKCSDIRDKIYAVMGLSNDAYELGVLPDYQKRPAQVFTDLAVARIHKDRRHESEYELSVLTWVGRTPSPDLHFPSWVPSFTSSRYGWPMVFFGSSEWSCIKRTDKRYQWCELLLNLTKPSTTLYSSPKVFG